MNIIKHYPQELTKAQLYKLTMSPKTVRMKDAKGQVLEIAAWCIYEDTDSNGELRTVLSLLTPEGESLATNSGTFMIDFKRMVDLFGVDGIDKIEIIGGTSKQGRQYITCAYAG